MDELTLHRYLDGRLDERQRGSVEAALRADPAARRTLDALREESRLIGAALEAQSEPLSGAGRIGARVVATLHLEERSRAASLRTRKFVRRVCYSAGLAAALAVCFLLVKPRTPAGSVLSGTHVTIAVHGEKRDGQKGANVYDGDGISTEKGQFIRLSLSGAQSIDIDEFSDLMIEKSGSAPVLRMTRGRIGATVGDNHHTVQIELPQGVVTVQPGTRADIWLPEPTAVRLPEIFLSAAALPAAAPAAQNASAIVTVFKGYAQIVCDKNGASFNARQGVRAQFTKTEVQPRLVNMAGSRVLDMRGDDGLHTRDNMAPVEWTLLGVMEKPQFETLGRRWGLGVTDAAGSAPIVDALKQLDEAMRVQPHAARAEKIADGQKALRQACETLAQNDDRRRMALTLEGLAHFEQGCARVAAGGKEGSDPHASFEAARVAFDSALAGDTAHKEPATPNVSVDWRSAYAGGVGAPAFASLPAEAQAALTASFRRAVALSWSARIMPPQLVVLDCEEATLDISEKPNAMRTAADAFAQLHDELGHTVESLAALLGEAICDLRAGDAPSRRKALDALHVLVSKPISGTDGPARQAFEGIRQAALIELVRINACGHEAQKTLDAAHDYELIFPLDSNAPQSKDVRALLMKGLEAQKTAAFAEKRYDNAVEACDGLLSALDEVDGHWLDAGQIDTPTGVRHVGVRLDRLDALVGAKDWVRASGEGHLLNGNLPAELLPRYNVLQAQIRSAQSAKQ